MYLVVSILRDNRFISIPRARARARARVRVVHIRRSLRGECCRGMEMTRIQRGGSARDANPLGNPPAFLRLSRFHDIASRVRSRVRARMKGVSSGTP